MMAKVDVNGAEAASAVEVAQPQKRRACSARKAIKWNFTKFLVGKDGQVIKRFAPNDTPESLQGRHRGRARRA